MNWPFTSDVFMDCVVAVVISLIAYFVSYLFCTLQGLGKDEISRVLGFLKRAEKNLSTFLNLWKKKTLSRNKARKLLLSIKLYIGNSASALQVYVYDEEDDKPKIRSAAAKLSALEHRCDNIALYYNEGNDEKLEAAINGITGELRKIEGLINLYKKELDENRKKVI